MRSKLGLSAIALVAMSTAAFAADVPPVAAPAFTWSGFYAGGNVGGGFNDHASYGFTGITPGTVNSIATGRSPGFLQTDASGVAAGAQIGYNFQFNQGPIGPVTGLFGRDASSGPVVGIEADADYTHFKSSVGFIGATGFGTNVLSDQSFLGTVRGRLGYGFGDLLVYGTGGFAYGRVHDNILLSDPSRNQIGSGGVNRFQTGYTYGGGVEYAIPAASFINVFHSSAVTLKVEYLHYVLGDNFGTVFDRRPAFIGNNFNVRIRDYGDIVRSGINYKF